MTVLCLAPRPLQYALSSATAYYILQDSVAALFSHAVWFISAPLAVYALAVLCCYRASVALPPARESTLISLHVMWMCADVVLAWLGAVALT